MADLLEGYNSEGGEDFCEDVYNLLKNHWRQSDPITNLAGKTAGMIVSDSDDDRLYHISGESVGYDEILQENASFAASPSFTTLFLNQATSKLFIRETSNTFMTNGITLNMMAAADETLAFKQTNVNHGVTQKAEKDTFAYFSIVSSTEGGLLLVGFSESEQAFNFVGVCTTGNTDKDATAKGPIIMKGRQKVGTTWGALGANENIFVVMNHSNAVAFIDVEGDFYYDGALNNFDSYNDAVACIDLANHLGSLRGGPLKPFLQYNRRALERMGVVSKGGFVSNKNMTALILGAIGQLYRQLKEV